MTIPIMITKVMLPARREEILSRQRLSSLFDELLDCKLIIVTAPAGYGKTSLLIDIAHHSELPFCWFTLDPLDQDILRFLAHFVACLNRRFPAFGEQSRAALEAMSQGSLNIDQIEIVIINEIYQTIREYFVIVLDDYQLVDESQAINQFINRFIQDVDQNCHLAITSRSLLPFTDLPLMVARSQVGGLGLQELAFRAEEIQALMLKNYQQAVPAEAAAELAQKTDGWITGLLLSAQNMWQGMIDRLRLARVSGVGLYEYLIQQVLGQQPPDIREFLLRTSFLDEFNAELCAELLGPHPPGRTWQGMLDEVLGHNLFVLPVGEAGAWLRYHHLFRDFLQSQFSREHPDEVDEILQRIIEVFTSQEEWEKAYSYCQRLGNLETTAELIEKAGESLVVDGRAPLLKKWLDALPLDLIHKRPVLLARYGIALATQRETARGLEMLDQAVSLLRETSNQARLAGTLVWRALAHYLRADYPLALADTAEVFSLTQDLQGKEKMARFQAEAYRISGQCYRMMGELPKAVNHFDQALDLCKRYAISTVVNRVISLLGEINTDMGNFQAALGYYQQALAYYRQQKNTFSSASILNDMACLHYLRGEYLEAFSTFNDALVKARQSGNAWAEGLILIGLADLYADLGSYPEALVAYQRGRVIIERIKDEYLLIYIDLAEAALARQRGEYSLAHAHLNSAETLLQESKVTVSRGSYLLESGLLAMAEKDIERAVVRLAEANGLFVAGRQRADEIRANCILAAAEFEREDAKQASLWLRRARRLAADLDGGHILVHAARNVKDTLRKMALLENESLPAKRLLVDITAFEADLARLKRRIRMQETPVEVTSPRLSIQALGEIQVRLGNRPVTSNDWQTQVTRDFLYLVLSERRGWSKEEIGESLWPGSTAPQINQRFKNTIYRLRRALNQEVILFAGGNYSFNYEIDYVYDVQQFEGYLAQARSAQGIEAQIGAYQAALHIYGEYLPIVEGDWVVLQRLRLQREFLEAGIQLTKLLMQIGRNPEALELCLRLISVDPCLEEAYRIAMSLYAHEGKRAAVVDLYNNLQKTMLEYTGAAPCLQTIDLYHSLVA